MGIQLFNSPQFGQVRTAGTPDSPLFCALDIARALGYSNPAKAVIDHCKGVTILETPTPGGVQSIKYIPEADMYRLIFKSNAPKAEEFNSWVSEDVLPAIRRTGGYIPAGHEETPEEIMAKAMVIANRTLELQKQKLQMLQGEKDLLKKENESLAPKAEYTDRVLMAPGNYTHSDMAKELGFRSWKDFVAELKRRGIMYRSSGGMYYLYADYSGKGYTTTRTAVYNTSSGEGKDTYTVWTEKGRMFLHGIFGIDLPAVDGTMFDFTKDN